MNGNERLARVAGVTALLAAAAFGFGRILRGIAGL